MPEEEFVPTSAEDYPAAEDQKLTLPSGAKVIVRAPSAFKLFSDGAIPDGVMKTIMDVKAGKPVSIQRQMQALDVMIAAAFVKPRVSVSAKKGCLPIAKLRDEDRIAVIEALGLSL